MVLRKGDVPVFRLWLFAATWQYYLCLGSASFPGTKRVHWTLYSVSGLSLTWNEASMFCKSLGGHLPVFNTKLKMNGFTLTARRWQAAAQLTQDVWTGLYTPTPKKDPTTWEPDCSPQPGGLSFWGANEPDSLTTDLCARYNIGTHKLHTMTCSIPYSVVCEFDKGSCLYAIRNGSLVTPSTLSPAPSVKSDMDSCWQQCISDPPSSTGLECVGAVYNEVKRECTGYLGDSLLSALSVRTDNSSLLIYAMVKECFTDNVCDCYTNYTFVDKRSLPKPAGDPCVNGSFAAVVPVPTKAECRQKALEQSTTLAASEPSSTEQKAETTRQAKNEASAREDSSPAASRYPDVTSSNPLADVSLSTQGGKKMTRARSGATSGTSPSTFEYTSTFEESTHHEILPASGVTKYVPSTQGVSSTRGSPRLLCPCKKAPPSPSVHLAIVPRNATSRHRRRWRCEWGSPSVLTSTGSTVFVAFTGVAGLLFLACDTQRLANLCGKTRHRKCKTPAV